MESTIMRGIGYALAVWICLGLIGVDTYLILDLLRQSVFHWWHLLAIWLVAFGNIMFIFLATIVYGSARMGV